MPSGPEGYLVGRGSIPFPEKGDPISDKMIAAQRLDEKVLKGRSFNHCTFRERELQRGPADQF